MKNITEFIKEAAEDQVYAVYFGDGTLYNYSPDESEANEWKDKLNTEAPSNKCTVKKEPITNFQK